MKNKEDILKEHSEGAIFAEGLVYDGFTDAIYTAMDQYSEQKEKELLKWLREELFITKHPDEVYDLYKKSK